jgi:sRNA-binding carbon storage regulator CsrA
MSGLVIRGIRKGDRIFIGDSVDIVLLNNRDLLINAPKDMAISRLSFAQQSAILKAYNDELSAADDENLLGTLESCETDKEQ